MTKSRWWVLVVLAAFFSMHGVQCMPGESSAMSTSAMAPAGAIVELAPGAADHPTASTDPTASTPATHGAASDEADPHGSGPSSPLGSAMAHLSAACLAVLSATLAALVAVAIALAIARFVLTTRPSAPRWVQRLSPLHPPDIFALCVLRT